MKEKPERKTLSEKALKLVFSVVLIAAAVGLFLISDAGRKLLAGGSDESETTGEAGSVSASAAGVTPEETQTPYPLPEDFIAAVEQNGPEGQYICMRTGAEAADYTIARKNAGLDPAYLSVSLTDGRMTAFMLMWNTVEPPEPAEGSATLVEQDLYRLRLERYESERAWLKDAFIAMAEAFDVTDSVTEASLEVLFHLAQETLEDGKTRSDTEGDYEFSVFTEEKAAGNTLTIVFSSNQSKK